MSGILSVGTVVITSHSTIISAFVLPSSACNNLMPQKKQPLQPRPYPSTNILFFRDEDDDSLHAIGGASSTEAEHPSSTAKKKSSSSDFQSRMKRIVVQQRRSTSTTQRSKSLYRPKNVKMVSTLEEFGHVIEKGRNEGRVVVVRLVKSRSFLL